MKGRSGIMEGRCRNVANAGLAVLLASLPLPAIIAGEDRYTGLQCLVFGWMAVWNRPVPSYGWFGNILLVLSLVAMWLAGSTRVGMDVTRVALGMSITFASAGLVVGLHALSLWRGFAPNEAGVITAPAPSFGPSFLLWLLSYVVVATGGVWAWFGQARSSA